MPLAARFFSSFCVAAGLAGWVCAQEAPKKGKQLTARELYYAAVQAPRTEPRSDPKPKAAPPKAAGKPKPADPGSPVSSNPAPPTPTPSAPTPAVGGALGLRYNVVKLTGDREDEVAPDTVFHAGDHIQLNVEANSAGYLYVISQGSSGTWKPMFPSPEVENGDNHVESMRRYTLPSKEHQMTLDETAGSEKLFIILSRKPEPDLEKLIYSLQGKPASEPKQLVTGAEPKIADATVGRMRKAYARDLIIEKVTPATAGEKKETAVYVVNPTGSPNSRVVADLTLAHR